MNITFFSHTYIGSPFVVGSHHLAKQFALQGDEVVHVSHPVSIVHMLLGRAERLLHNGFKSDRLFQFTPIGIIPLKLMLKFGFGKLAGIMLWFMIPKMLKLKILNSDLILIDDPAYYVLQNYLKKGVVFYRPTDDYSAMEGGYVEMAELDILKNVSGVIVTHRDLEIKFRTHYNYCGPIKVVENGVDLNVFNRIAPEINERHKNIKLIYIGSLDQRFDVEILCFLKSRDDVVFEIYSPDCNSLEQEGNVFYKGRVSFVDVPEVMATADILVLPFIDSKANRTRSPMKLYEYASTGLPILMPDFMSANDITGVYQYKYLDFDSFNSALDLAFESRKKGVKKRNLHKHSWYGKANIIKRFCIESGALK